MMAVSHYRPAADQISPRVVELEGEWKISFENGVEFVKQWHEDFFRDRVLSAWDLSFCVYHDRLLLPWKFYRLTDSVQLRIYPAAKSKWGRCATARQRLASFSSGRSKNERRREKISTISVITKK